MITDDGTTIHGLRTRYADDGVEVYYAYPGALDVRIADGITMPVLPPVPYSIVLGILLADLTDQDPREDHGWRWPAHTTPATRRWAQHVTRPITARRTWSTSTTANSRSSGRSSHRVPTNSHCWIWASPRQWRLGGHPQPPRLARSADKLVGQRRSSSRPTLGTQPVVAALDAHDHANAVEHAWLRWAALMDTNVLKVEKRSYDFKAPPQRDGSALVLHYRTRNADLRLTLDVARHPFYYDATIAVGDRGKPPSAPHHLGRRLG